MPPKQKMKAAVIHGFDGLEKVLIEEIDIPTPQDNEVQIAVEYAGVNPVDWKICEGLLKNRMDYEFPIILGWDAAGKVSAKGKNVTHLKEGDSVFAYCKKEIVHEGAYAEFICLNASHVVKKPKKISASQAASFPLSSLTAWQSLFDTAHLKAKDNVLIHAGAGGVGGFAIQLAKLMGAKVITTTSSSHHDYVKALGADEIIDYTKENFVEKIHALLPEGVDVVYDTVGGSTLKASYQAAKEGGRLVTIAGIIDQALAVQRHLEAEFVFVTPNGEELGQIAELIEKGKLVPPPIHEVPLEDAKSALRKSREGHTEGKIVLKI